MHILFKCKWNIHQDRSTLENEISFKTCKGTEIIQRIFFDHNGNQTRNQSQKHIRKGPKYLKIKQHTLQ